MIRPIDTQILYPQSPELSNKQQVDNQKPALQQDAFAQIMKDEVTQKKERVQQTEKDSKVKNDPNEKKKKQQSKKGKQSTKDKKDGKKPLEERIIEAEGGATKIDMQL